MKHRHTMRSPSEMHPTARKMGRKIADLGGSGDAVTEADLLTDFSASDIKTHIEAARGYARQLLGSSRGRSSGFQIIGKSGPSIHRQPHLERA